MQNLLFLLIDYLFDQMLGSFFQNWTWQWNLMFNYENTFRLELSKEFEFVIGTQQAFFEVKKHYAKCRQCFQGLMLWEGKLWMEDDIQWGYPQSKAGLGVWCF